MSVFQATLVFACLGLWAHFSLPTSQTTFYLWVRAMLLATRQFSIVFVCSGLTFLGLGELIEHTLDADRAGATLLDMESTIERTKNLVSDQFTLSALAKLSILIVLLFLGSFISGLNLGLIHIAFSKLMSLLKYFYIALVVLSSFTFFYSSWIGEVKNNLARLNSRIESEKQALGELQEKYDEIAVELVSQELYDQALLDEFSVSIHDLHKLDASWKKKLSRIDSVGNTDLHKKYSDARKRMLEDSGIYLLDRSSGKSRHRNVDSYMWNIELSRMGELDSVYEDMRKSINMSRDQQSDIDRLKADIYKEVVTLGVERVRGDSVISVVSDLTVMPKAIVELFFDSSIAEPVSDIIAETTRTLIERIVADGKSENIQDLSSEARQKASMRVLNVLQQLRFSVPEDSYLQIENSFLSSRKGFESLSSSMATDFKDQLATKEEKIRHQIESLSAVVPNVEIREAVIRGLDSRTSSIVGKASNDVSQVYHQLVKFEQYLERLSTLDYLHLVDTLATSGDKDLMVKVLRGFRSAVRNDSGTRWGEVREMLSAVLRDGSIDLDQTSLEQWRKIWRRWETHRNEYAVTHVPMGIGPVDDLRLDFETEFRRILNSDHELAAIWGFTAKSFLNASEREGFYKWQIERYSTPDKIRKNLDVIVYYGVLQPAIERGEASNFNDAIILLLSGKLDSSIDYEILETVIRNRGMIPAFGLEGYMLTTTQEHNQDVIRKELDRITATNLWDETISRYCR